MYLNLLPLGVGLKLSNPNPGGTEAALHLFVQQKPEIDWRPWVDSDRWNLQLLIPPLNLVSLLTRQIWFRNVTPRCNIVNQPSAYL
jgi:hypothetical protein